MATYKTKAIIAGSISITIIGIITIITLWPTNFTDELQSSDKLTVSNMITDDSKLNLVNLHMKVTNHTIITTTTMVACGIIIIITISIKENLANKRRKKQKTGCPPKTKDYPMAFH